MHIWRRFLHHTHAICGEFQISPHLSCGDIWKLGHICKIYSIFWHNLRAFMWRKIEPKSTFVEKKWQISGLYLLLTLHGLKQFWCCEHGAFCLCCNLRPQGYYFCLLIDMFFIYNFAAGVPLFHLAIWQIWCVNYRPDRIIMEQ